MVLQYSDHSIESLQTLTELLDNDENGDSEERAHDLLSRLEEVTRPDSGLALVPSTTSTSLKPATAGGTWPWEDSSGYSQATGYVF